MARVILVDEDHLFLDLLEYTLNKDFGEFQVVEKLDLNANIINGVAEFKPDVLIIGIYPNNDRGIECIETIHKNYPEVKVIVLSVSEDGNDLPRLLNAGISSYLLRNCSIFKLCETILSVVTGILPKTSRDKVVTCAN